MHTQCGDMELPVLCSFLSLFSLTFSRKPQNVIISRASGLSDMPRKSRYTSVHERDPGKPQDEVV